MDDRKTLLKEEKTPSWDMLLNIDGILKHSAIFYGWYSDCAHWGKYKVPTAYFMIGIGVYIYSFIATLRKMAVNFRLSKLSEKEDECIFTWKLFTGWDYMIGNAETGHNRTSSIVLGFKEALLEEAEKKKEKRSWKIISIRVFVNLNVVWMLIFSARAVIYVVNKSSDDRERNNSDSFVINWWYQNETTVVMTVIGSVFPFIFEMFGLVEKYHPRKTLRIQLARIMALNLLNLYTLTFAQFNQINEMTRELGMIKQNLTYKIVPNDQFDSAAAQIMTATTLFSPAGSISNERIPFTPPFGDQNVSHAKRKRALEYYGDYTVQTPTRTTSLKDQYYNNQGHFTDPATGKYDKPLPSTTSAKNLSGLIRSSMIGELTKPTTLSTAIVVVNNNESTTTTTMTETDDELSENDFTSTSFFFDNVTYDNENTTDLWPEENTTEFDPLATSEDVTEEPYNSTQTEYATTEESTSGYLDNSTSTFPSTEQQKTITTSDVTNATIPATTTTTTTIASLVPSIPTMATLVTNVTTTSSVQTSFTTESPISSTTLATTVVTIPTAPSTCAETTSNPFGTEPIENFCNKTPITDYTTRLRLRKLCWETMFGQELVKLTVMDLVSNFVSTFFGDFIRALLVRYMNKIWCWDLEKKFPKYADFKIAENILHLVNNQGLVWMGMFFSPGLPLINVVKLMIMMYLRSWAVLTCNVPHEVVFRASRSNNFYLALLLTMLFLCVLPVCYAIVWLKPSWHCGPFSGHEQIYKIFARTLQDILPKNLHNAMNYMASPGTVIPLIIVLLLFIYYLASLTSALREANIDLKVQLRRERTEERKKMFQMASRRKRGGSDIDGTFAKWKKILQEVPSIKMSEDSPFSDFLEDHRRDDTDVDNGFLKHDEDEEKLRRIFKTRRRPDTTADDKWDTLLKMVPKTSPKINVKDSSSTTSSLKDDSSAPSEIIPEIKISRVQTMENILKSDAGTTTKSKQQRKSSQSSSEKDKVKDTRIKIKPSILEKWQQKRKDASSKPISEPAMQPEIAAERTDPPIDEPPDIELDDVFLQTVVVDVPELPKIQDSISNRIKRRLRKVISVGSSGEAATSSDSSERRTAEPTSWDPTKREQQEKKCADDLSKTVRLQQTLIENDRQLRLLLKADSWHTVPGEKLPTRLEKRRRSSLSDLREIRTHQS